MAKWVLGVRVDNLVNEHYIKKEEFVSHFLKKNCNLWTSG
jgi:hypothetical protein